MFTILFVVFSSIRGQSKEDFAIYLVVGIFFYHLFSRGTSGGLTSLVQNGGILKSIKIKREIFPVVATATTVIFLLVELLVLFGLMPVFSFVPTWTVVYFPLVLILFLGLVLGMSYLLSILYIFIRDTQPVWTVISYALIFVSPIFWYLSEVEGILLEIHKINVLGQIIELGHKVIVFGQVPPLNEWVYTSAFVVGILIVGFGLFKKFENKVAERV
jgi:lipopolysaccharide transport system permease protein